MFFTTVYIFSFLILRTVFSVINVSILSTPYLPSVLTLGISLLLASKAAFNLDFMVIKPGFVLKAIYNYSFVG